MQDGGPSATGGFPASCFLTCCSRLRVVQASAQFLAHPRSISNPCNSSSNWFLVATASPATPNNGDGCDGSYAEHHAPSAGRTLEPALLGRAVVGGSLLIGAFLLGWASPLSLSVSVSSRYAAGFVCSNDPSGYGGTSYCCHCRRLPSTTAVRSVDGGGQVGFCGRGGRRPSRHPTSRRGTAAAVAARPRLQRSRSVQRHTKRGGAYVAHVGATVGGGGGRLVEDILPWCPRRAGRHSRAA